MNKTDLVIYSIRVHGVEQSIAEIVESVAAEFHGVASPGLVSKCRREWRIIEKWLEAHPEIDPACHSLATAKAVGIEIGGSSFICEPEGSKQKQASRILWSIGFQRVADRDRASNDRCHSTESQSNDPIILKFSNAK